MVLTKNRRCRGNRRRAKAAGGGDVTVKPLLGNWLPEIQLKNVVPDLRVLANQVYQKASILLNEITNWYERVIAQDTVKEMKRFTLSVNASPEDVRLFLEKKRQHSLNIAPMIIVVEVDGVKIQVPVTPKKPVNDEDISCHMIVIDDPGTGNAIQLLVVDYSGYIKASRVVLRGEVESRKAWNLLGSDGLPSRFKITCQTNYSEGYELMQGIQIHSGTLREIFKFFLSFNEEPDQPTTTEGQRTLETTYVSLGESPRFVFAKNLFIDGVARPISNPCELLDWHDVAIHDWSGFSTDSLQLCLAMLESNMVRLGSSPPGAHNTMVKARSQWKIRQDSHIFWGRSVKEVKPFYVELEGVECKDTPIFLDALCGRHLMLVRYNDQTCGKLHLRSLRYRGYWEEEIQEAYEAGKLNMHFLVK